MLQDVAIAAAEPPGILPLAAHPVRWRLLQALATSDRGVQDLTRRVGQPQNLVSYHLAKLRAGGVVFARRSEADRRDTFYGLDLPRFADSLSAAGGALHPGLRRPASRPPPATPLPRRVLFLCTGNSARSQMAEALLRARGGGSIEAFSAGSHPRPLHPNAVRVMRELFDLDISGQAPKRLEVFDGQAFDRVITLCDRVREVCPEFPGPPEPTHWSLPNPATGEADAATYPRFRDTAAELSGRIDFLIAALAATPPAAEPGDRHDPT